MYCVLRMSVAKGIARLVSAFRYTDAAYLVLEYAADGDLHSHVIKHGSLLFPDIDYMLNVVTRLITMTDIMMSLTLRRRLMCIVITTMVIVDLNVPIHPIVQALCRTLSAAS